MEAVPPRSVLLPLRARWQVPVHERDHHLQKLPPRLDREDDDVVVVRLAARVVVGVPDAEEGAEGSAELGVERAEAHGERPPPLTVAREAPLGHDKPRNELGPHHQPVAA